jgi:hypothetical protein
MPKSKVLDWSVPIRVSETRSEASRAKVTVRAVSLNSWPATPRT